MLSKIFFKKAFLFLLITGLVNWVAYAFYLYWTVWWIDILAHFLGGVTVGFAVLWILSFKRNFTQFSFKKILFLSLVGTIFVGIAWEFLELYIRATSISDGFDYWFDTFLDLIMDTLGGFFAVIYSTYFLKRNG